MNKYDSDLDDLDGDDASNLASSSMKNWDRELSDDDGDADSDSDSDGVNTSDDTIVEFEDNDIESDVEPQKKGKFPVVLLVAGIAIFGVGGFVGFSQIFGSGSATESPAAPAAVLETSSFDSNEGLVALSTSSFSASSISSVISGLQGESYIAGLQGESPVSGLKVESPIAGLKGEVVSAEIAGLTSSSEELALISSSQSISSAARVIYPPMNQDKRVSPGIPAGQLGAFLNSTSAADKDAYVGVDSAKSDDVAISSRSASSASIAQPSAADLDVDQLKKLLSSISEELKDLKRMQLESDLKIEATSQKINSAAFSGSKNNASVEPVVSKGAPSKERKRLPGFKITSASPDGKMSIVSVERGNHKKVIVLFEGERFISSTGALKVTGVEKNGGLLLVGNDWFIDETLDLVVEAKVKKDAVKPKSSSSSSSISSRVSASSAPSMIIAHSKPSMNTKVSTTGSVAAPVSGVADGWSLNGVYNDQFLVSSPSGGLSQVKKGDKIQGLGIVSGVNSSGELIVGSFRIKSP